MMKSGITLCFGMTVIWSIFLQPLAFSHPFKWRIRYLIFKKRQKYHLFHLSHHTNPSITNAETMILLYDVTNTTTICSHLTEDDNTNDYSLTEKGKNEKRRRGIENNAFTSMFSLRLLTGIIKPSRPVRLRPPTVPLTSKLVSLEKKGFMAKLTIY